MTWYSTMFANICWTCTAYVTFTTCTWSITSGMPVMSAHIVVDDDTLRDGGRLLDRLGACLSEHFDVEHSTCSSRPGMMTTRAPGTPDTFVHDHGSLYPP